MDAVFISGHRTIICLSYDGSTVSPIEEFDRVLGAALAAARWHRDQRRKGKRKSPTSIIFSKWRSL